MEIYKKILVIICIILIPSLIVYSVNNSKPLKNEKLFNFPLFIDQWVGDELMMEAWVFESLETPYAILRNYTLVEENETINLAIVWYDDREIAFHAPEACLGGVGNRVKEKKQFMLKTKDGQELLVGKLLVEKNGEKSLVLYYFINDEFITNNHTSLRKEVLLKKIYLKRTSAAFVRIMTLIRKSPQKTEELLSDFLLITLPLIRDYTTTPL